MSAPGSVTYWIAGLRAGDEAAAQKLWEGYFHKLVNLARRKLKALPRGAGDEEDVALSALKSFCRGAGQGRFPRLNDRDDLWQVLLLITERKAIDLIQHETRLKRDCRKVKAGESGADRVADAGGHEPDPQFAVQMAEELQRLLGLLGDDKLRQLALLKLEGYTNQEIARQLGCALATVERRLQRIRKEWQAAS
jgi:RNA polymerase sigma factor (sigma-70 family)